MISRSTTCIAVCGSLLLSSCSHAFTATPRLLSPLGAANKITSSSQLYAKKVPLPPPPPATPVEELQDKLQDAMEDLQDVMTSASTGAKNAMATMSDSLDDQLDAIADIGDSATVQNLATSTGLSPDIVLAAGAVGLLVLVLAVVAASAGGSADSSSSSAADKPRTKKPTTKKADVSIPYDAAATLAYEAWLQDPAHAETKDTQATFDKYKLAYEEMAIATVVAKKKARDMATFDPNKPAAPVAAPAVVTQPKTATAKTSASSDNKMFFASVKK